MVHRQLQLKEIRYVRQLESVTQIDNEMTKLIKNNFTAKIAIILQEQKNNGYKNI